MYSHIDSKIMDTMLYFRIPDAINVLINAHVTKFVFKMLGGASLLA